MPTLLKPFQHLGVLIVLLLSALMLTACSTTIALPEGAQAPKLQIESLTLVNAQDEPYFVVTYNLEHRSLTDLPLHQVRASVFIRDTLVAVTRADTKGTMISNQGTQQLQVKVPVNVGGAATFDSLANSSLLMLQGSCALSLIFTDDPEQKSFNPSASYSGLIRVTR